MHKLGIAGIVAYRLNCSGCDIIVKLGHLRLFIVLQQLTEKSSHASALRPTTVLNIKRHVCCSVLIDNGRCIVSRDNIIVEIVPRVPKN